MKVFNLIPVIVATILFIVILATVFSEKSEEYYYLQASDSATCVNIVNKNNETVIILDKKFNEHANSTEILMMLNTQMGFNSPYKASEAYWRVVK